MKIDELLVCSRLFLVLSVAYFLSVSLRSSLRCCCCCFLEVHFCGETVSLLFFDVVVVVSFLDIIQ